MTIKLQHKLYPVLARVASRYHFAPLDEGLNGKRFHKNHVLMALSYLLDGNHLIVGEPGWGKTTGAKIIAASLSGVPYDLFDSLEIRGHPQKYEEKMVARFNFGKLHQGAESVVWQGTFGLPVLIVDEVNRLPPDSQDVVLQGIDTGRWTYANASVYEGKKPTFMTMNERDGDRENGLLPALRDRISVVTEEGYFSTMVVFDLDDARRAVEAELCEPAYTASVLSGLAESFDAFKERLRLPSSLKEGLSGTDKKQIRTEIDGLVPDNDLLLFLQAFMAEINFSAKYGTKRSADPTSDDTHDLHYAGVAVNHSFSPRSAMAALNYAKGLAWLLEERPSLDHMRVILPHVFAHKAHFTDDYNNARGNDNRVSCSMLHLASELVSDVHGRYVSSIQPMKNLVAQIQRALAKGESPASLVSNLDPNSMDHPLMRDLVATARGFDKTAFYGSDE